METMHLYRPDHLAAVLGGFSFAGADTVVYTGVHDARWHVPLTIFHEKSHQTIAGSTPFGALQYLLAWVSGRTGQGVPEWVSAAPALLRLSVRHSTVAHEGYAVHSEYVLARAAGARLPWERLPADYQQAYALYARMTSTLPDAYEPFEPLIAKAAAFIVFGSPLPRAWDFRCGTAAELAALMESPDHAPDQRLRRLADTLQLSAEGAERLHAYRALAPECGLPADRPVYEAMRRVAAGEHPELRDALFRIAAELVDAAVPVCCPGLAFVPAAGAEACALELLEDARTYLGPRGIRLPKCVPASECTPTELADVRFRQRPAHPPRLLSAAEAVPVLAAPEEAASAYVVHLFFRPVRDPFVAPAAFVADGPAGPGGVPGFFFAHLLRHRRVEGVEDMDGEAYLMDLDGRQPLVYGSWDEVREVVAALGERAMVVAADDSVADLGTATVWSPVEALARALGTEVVVVAPGTDATRLRDRLVALRTAGLADGEIAADDDVVWVVALTCRTGLRVILPVAAPALLSLESEAPELAGWMLDVLEATMTRPGRDPDASEGKALRAWAGMMLLDRFEVVV
jgi:hypothetical protein